MKMPANELKTQIVLAGIGGQGILFSSKIFSELGLKLGLDITGAETHGMSQRGGSVVAHVKLGGFQSPLVREGNADILYSFDETETYRNVHFLSEGGSCFVSMTDPGRFNKKIRLHLEKKAVRIRTYDAAGRAMHLGSARAANICLIGFSVGTGLVPFEYDDVKDVLKSISRTADLELNLRILDKGFKAGLESRK